MALPTLTYTWQFNVNQVMPPQASYAALRSKILWNIVESLKGFASSPWTQVAASSLWTTETGLTWVGSGGGSRSWILLRQTGLGANFEVLIDCLAQSSGYNQITYTSCPDGFDYSTADAANPPVPNGLSWNQQLYQGFATTQNNNTGGYLHVMMSTGGEATWFFYIEDGDLGTNCCAHPNGWLLIPDGALWTPGWTNPVITIGGGWSGDGYPSYTNYNALSTYVVGVYPGDWNAEFRMYLTSEGVYNYALGQYQTVPDDDTGEWPMVPVGLACTTFGMRGGRRGTVPDLWWGPTARATGDTYPLTSTPLKQFVQLGDWILPWNGTTMKRI
jgi:hypothetical protein